MRLNEMSLHRRFVACVVAILVHCAKCGFKNVENCSSRENPAELTLALVQLGMAVGKRNGSPVAVPPISRRHPRKAFSIPHPVHRTNRSAAELAGVTYNDAGDLVSFLTAVGTNVILSLVCLIIFSYLRFWYPQVYSNNIKNGVVQLWASPSRHAWSWARASLGLRHSDINSFVGLDMTMLMEFCHMSMRILLVLSVPLVFVLGPLHFFKGGNRSGNDKLSKWGMANVQNGSWLYWLHSGMVWFTIIVVQKFVYLSMSSFMKRRKMFLEEMPHPRATTILVENIPAQYCSDQCLKDLFNSIFGEDAVSSAFVVKDTSYLLTLTQRKEACLLEIEKANTAISIDPEHKRPTFRSVTGEKHDTLEYFLKLFEDTNTLITQERTRLRTNIDEHEEMTLAQRKKALKRAEEAEANRIALMKKRIENMEKCNAETKACLHPEQEHQEDESSKEEPAAQSAPAETDQNLTLSARYLVLGYESNDELADSIHAEESTDSGKLIHWWTRDSHSTSGFVTFRSRKDSEMALCSRITSNDDELVVSIPPDPSDVLYSDLVKDPHIQSMRESVGHMLVGSLFIIFMPFISSIAIYSNTQSMSRRGYTFAIYAVKNYPSICAIWDAMVPSVALDLFMGLFPTLVGIISGNFFALKAVAWLQVFIQIWYYWFLVIYVLLITAVGNSILETSLSIAEDPLTFTQLLAQNMPDATHFYLVWVPLQWFQHAKNLLRIPNLAKFQAWKAIYEEDTAREMSEPEDQDYYGIGSRSARFTLVLVVCLVFSTLSPLITLLGFVNFFICRLVYGYLTVYAEMKKVDLGGVFFVQQLVHLQKSMYLYGFLMIGVLLQRSSKVYPGVIAAGSVLYLHYSHTKFYSLFEWQCLPLEHLKDAGKSRKRVASRNTYEQPELLLDTNKT
eukprot:TRINITY_DN3581_c0_g1_i4.p1 TRINITY_DN3581_c0_g1~~TRINITY_DN3581_c0_g1_i4.p1  ORF type:complete len:902 (-),score=125.90 TRINITY_DN3581_c0_g1_i4:206-2911(-)